MARSLAGFSTVEVLVALIVFDLGLLGAVSTTALATRLLTDARNRAGATVAISDRIEMVRNAARAPNGCAALTGGTRPLGGGVSERWALTGSGPTRLLDIIITSTTARGIHADTVRTVVSCG
ncbi:MAG TPA: hypothetical protein VLB12_14760 [Gemmatimonadales bacterium]|nr:hypothetical protein [Gemmatimonadales bacterium]